MRQTPTAKPPGMTPTPGAPKTPTATTPGTFTPKTTTPRAGETPTRKPVHRVPAVTRRR